MVWCRIKVCFDTLSIRNLFGDVELVSRWHRESLSTADKTLLQVGKNAIALINSYPEKATERTSLTKSTSIGTFEKRWIHLSSRNCKRSICGAYWTISACDLQSEKIRWYEYLPTLAYFQEICYWKRLNDLATDWKRNPRFCWTILPH